MNKLLTFMILCCFFSSCSNNNKKNKESKSLKTEKILPQNYEVYQLPKELNEISGITFINDSLIAAIEDENGIVYFYDLLKKEIVKTIEFSTPDDFEDLVKVGNDIYVVRADGTIFKIENFTDKKPVISQFKTQLSTENNIESLAFDSRNNTLLLAVKDKNIVKDKETKGIYSFSLATKKLNTTPTYQIKLDAIEAQFKGDAIEESSKKFLKIIGNQNLNEIIRPSAMAFHPVSHDLYVLSAINQIIVVISKDNVLKKVIPFKGKEFIQPEGIAFNAKGELYISNEGKNKAGNIIKITGIDTN
ncbi:SdiA-regulated domain-containing protein [Pedobacter cryophilus]|uniref:SdiA-regulated family protein n=1 Tax=Pedobacter cryophilus TaxID=2571271 RepID=A0A4U1C3R3_9SPHI|nr:SdiA-regulated domain-containing protein [Pedobacter cryophilus]TKB98749.1 hypothetical protein FA046_06425 [Pedobacter cryophilus]